MHTCTSSFLAPMAMGVSSNQRPIRVVHASRRASRSQLSRSCTYPLPVYVYRVSFTSGRILWWTARDKCHSLFPHRDKSSNFWRVCHQLAGKFQSLPTNCETAKDLPFSGAFCVTQQWEWLWEASRKMSAELQVAKEMSLILREVWGLHSKR